MISIFFAPRARLIPISLVLSLTLASIILVNGAAASGFRIPEVSIAGLASSNALVADTETPGALAYNPAAMAFHDKRVLVVSLVNARPTFDADPDLIAAYSDEARQCRYDR